MRYFQVPLQTIGAPIISSALYFLIFGVSLGSAIQSEASIPYLVFLIPGLLAMNMVKNAFENSTGCITGAKYVNELQDLRTAPLTKEQIIWAKSLASLSRGFIVGILTFVIGSLFYFLDSGLFLTIKHPLILVLFMTVGTLTFAQLGIAIGMWAKSFEQIGGVSAFILTPLIYLGGVFFTLENLHPIWQKISLFNPLLYIINGFRYGIIGKSDTNILLAFSITLAAFIICHLLAYRTLQKGSNYYR